MKTNELLTFGEVPTFFGRNVFTGPIQRRNVPCWFLDSDQVVWDREACRCCADVRLFLSERTEHAISNWFCDGPTSQMFNNFSEKRLCSKPLRVTQLS